MSPVPGWLVGTLMGRRSLAARGMKKEAGDQGTDAPYPGKTPPEPTDFRRVADNLVCI
ncbi:MAG: hypothetical protein WEB60_12255 [Terrimicrobiaceae bacterium]